MTAPGGPGVLAAALVCLAVAGGRWAGGHRRRSQALRRLAAGEGGPEPSPGRRPAAPAGVARRLAAAGVQADPASVWTAWLGATFVSASTTLVAVGPGGAAVLLAAAAIGPALWLRSSRGRGAYVIEAALPDVLEAVARGLRSGSSLVQALEGAADVTPGEVGADLRWLVAVAGQGGGVVPALEGWAARRPLPGIRLAGAALCLGVETGGAHARAIDGVAQTLRQRLAVAAEVRALSSQARMSGLVMAVAPLVFGAFAVATDSAMADFAFRTPLGLAVLTVGLALDAAGAVWMSRLVRVTP